MKSKTKADVTDGQHVAVRKVRQQELAENPIVVAFGRRLRQWRRENSKSLKQVALDLGVSVAIVSEWENCHRFPAVKTFQALVEYTGVPAWVFVQSEIGAKRTRSL